MASRQHPHRALTIGMATVAGALLGFALLLLAGAPARAEGLNFACETNPTANPGGEGEEQPVLDDAEIESVTPSTLSGLKIDVHAKLYDAAFPLGMTKDAKYDFDLLKLTSYPYNVADQHRYWLDVNGDGHSDLWFALRLRTFTKDIGLEKLLHDNFHLPWESVLDPSTFTTVNSNYIAGIELHYGRVLSPQALPFVAGDFTAGLVLEFTREDNSKFLSHYTLGVSSPWFAAIPDKGRFPQNGVITLGWKESYANDNQGWWMVNLDSTYAAPLNSPMFARPQIKYILKVQDTDAVGAPLVPPEYLVDMTLDWLHAPVQFALGTNQLCQPNPTAGFRSRGQVSFNQTLAASPTDNTVTMALRAGLDKGIEFNAMKHDELELGAFVKGIPTRFDWVMRPDAMQITHPGGMMPPPQFEISKLIAASLDTTLPKEQQRPFILTTKVANLPSRSVLRSEENKAAGTSKQAVEFCPAADPQVDPLPDGTVLEPFAPCAASPYTPSEATVKVQDFFDGDTLTALGIPAVPVVAQSDGYALYGANRNEITGCKPSGCAVPKRSAFRFAARLFNPRSGSVETMENDATDTSQVDVKADLASAQKVRAVIHTDGRTHRDDELLNTGTLLDADTVFDTVPASIKGTRSLTASLRTSTTQPLKLTSATPWNITKLSATATAQMTGPDALKLRAQAEVTPVPASVLLQWDKYVNAGIDGDGDDDNKDGYLQNTLNYSASTSSKLLAGGILSTFKERHDKRRTRFWVDTTVPKTMQAIWREREDGPLQSAKVTVCPAGDDKCSNIVKAIVIHSEIARDSGEDNNPSPNLLNPPGLPSVAGKVGGGATDEHPAFLPIGSSDLGLRAIVYENGDEDDWGVLAQVENIQSVRYDKASGPSKLCVLSTRPSTGKDFTINVYDENVPTGEQLYGDAVVTFLTKIFGARLAQKDAPSGDPMLQLTTEDCKKLDDPPKSVTKMTPTEIAAAPVVDAIVRYDNDDWTALRLGKKTGNTITGEASIVPDPGPRPGPANRVRAQVLIDTDGSQEPGGPANAQAAHAHIREPLPTNLVARKPVGARCDDSVEQEVAESCHDAPAYELDNWREYDVDYVSSLPDLGPLAVTARTVNGTGANDTDEDVRYDVTASTLPGSVNGKARITEFARLPWTLVHIELDGSTALGTVTATATDAMAPAFYRSGPATTVPTSNYGAVLSNVGSKLTVDGNMLDPESRVKVLTPAEAAPDPVSCETVPASQQGRQNFVHASVDLKNTATSVKVDARNYGGGTQAAVVSADAPVDTMVGTRVDHVVKSDHKTTTEIGAWAELTGTTMIGLGAVGGPWTMATGLLVLFAGLFDDESEFDACLDMDVPLQVDVKNSAQFRFGVRGSVLSLDHKNDPGAVGVLRMRQANLPNEPAFVANGVFHWNTHVHFTAPFSSDWDENHVNAFADAALHKYADCLSVEPPCFWANGSGINAINIANAPSGARSVAGFTTGDVLFDPMFGSSNRHSMYDRDESAWPERPGGEMYKVYAELASPMSNEDFNVPAITGSTAQTSGGSIVLGDGDCSGISSPQGIGGGSNTDGTTYSVKARCVADDYKSALIAMSAPGVHRWAVDLPDPIGAGGAGDDRCVGFSTSWSCVVDIQSGGGPGGSVIVTQHTTATPIFGSVSVDLGTRIAWFDASGNPFSRAAEDGTVPGTNVPALATAVGTPLELDQCPLMSTPGPCDLPGNFHQKVFWGDGAVDDTDGFTEHHQYPPLAATYHGMIVRYDPNGLQLSKAHFTVDVG